MRSSFRRGSALITAWTIATGACGPNTSGLQGISCSSDSDCNSGLKCLAYYLETDSGADGGCGQFGSVCQQPCKITSDCTEEGFVCVSSCGDVAACQLASAVPDAAAEATTDATTDVVTDGAADATAQ